MSTNPIKVTARRGAKILIVDDHDVVRQGTRAILQKARPEWEICGEAATGREAILAATAHKPDVVILDITMPDMSGMEAAPAIAKLAPGCRILLFTMHESNTLLTEARLIGAQGYVQKSQAGRYLIRAVDRLLAGDTFFGPDRSGAAEDKEQWRAESGDFLVHSACVRRAVVQAAQQGRDQRSETLSGRRTIFHRRDRASCLETFCATQIEVLSAKSKFGFRLALSIRGQVL